MQEIWFSNKIMRMSYFNIICWFHIKSLSRYIWNSSLKLSYFVFVVLIRSITNLRCVLKHQSKRTKRLLCSIFLSCLANVGGRKKYHRFGSLIVGKSCLHYSVSYQDWLMTTTYCLHCLTSFITFVLLLQNGNTVVTHAN